MVAWRGCACLALLTVPADVHRADPALARLNALPREDAVAAFAQCCAAAAWAQRMADARPFDDRQELLTVAEREWQELGPDAWRAAFAGHPRIGEGKAAAATTGTEQRWSAQEQSGMQRADDAARTQLAAAQRRYEAQFGHIFLICATGLGADDMLVALEARLHNDPETELLVAASEQARITRLRLEKLLTT
jgi:OHCU decarboxylase